jgi:hypothetical protein
MKKGSYFSTIVNSGVVGIVENPVYLKGIDILHFSVFSTFPQGIFIIIYVNEFSDEKKSIKIMEGSVRGVPGNWHSYRDESAD